MTLEELDTALAAMPASPIEPADVLARADLMRKRLSMTTPATPAQPPAYDAMVAVVPPLGIGCVEFRGARRYVRPDGRIELKWGEFAGLCASNQGQYWADANQELVPHIANFAMIR